MDTPDATSHGVKPGDTRCGHQPGHDHNEQHTDPLWYYAANLLAPKDIGSTKRRGWVEGFVAAMETLAERGEDGECLLETLNPAACTITPEILAQ